MNEQSNQEKTIIVLSELSDRQLSVEYERAVRDSQAAAAWRGKLRDEVLRRCEERDARKLPDAEYPLGRKPVSEYPLSLEVAQEIIEAADQRGVPDAILKEAIAIVPTVKTAVSSLRKIASDYGKNAPLGKLIETSLEAVKETKYEIDAKLPPAAAEAVQQAKAA